MLNWRMMRSESTAGKRPHSGSVVPIPDVGYATFQEQLILVLTVRVPKDRASHKSTRMADPDLLPKKGAIVEMFYPVSSILSGPCYSSIGLKRRSSASLI